MGENQTMLTNKIRKQNKRYGKKRPEAEEADNLTGILKSHIAERKIASVMNRKRGGAFFLCDVDGLKRINDRHGHQAGDECLKQVARILIYMIQPEDILGRMGGDEFLIFMPSCRGNDQAQEICRRMEKRFRTEGGKGRDRGVLSVTVVCTLWKPGDTCRSLLERAEDELRRRKTELNRFEGPEEKGKDPYVRDVRRVRKELMEQIRKPGAYCRDYETFKSIYRFLERGIMRSGQKACVVLITVVDEQGKSLLPHEKDALMEQLGENIWSTLRIGDVYTRYSSSQYLVLVIDTTEGQAEVIADRIRERFLEGSLGNNVLIHHCYELRPAKIGEILEQDGLYAEAEG